MANFSDYLNEAEKIGSAPGKVVPEINLHQDVYQPPKSNKTASTPQNDAPAPRSDKQNIDKQSYREVSQTNSKEERDHRRAYLKNIINSADYPVYKLEYASMLCRRDGIRAAQPAYLDAIKAADSIDQRAVATERRDVANFLKTEKDPEKLRKYVAWDAYLHILQRAPGFTRANFGLDCIKNGYPEAGQRLLIQASKVDPEMMRDPHFLQHLQRARDLSGARGNGSPQNQNVLPPADRSSVPTSSEKSSLGPAAAEYNANLPAIVDQNRQKTTEALQAQQSEKDKKPSISDQEIAQKLKDSNIPTGTVAPDAEGFISPFDRLELARTTFNRTGKRTPEIDAEYKKAIDIADSLDRVKIVKTMQELKKGAIDSLDESKVSQLDKDISELKKKSNTSDTAEQIKSKEKEKEALTAQSEEYLKAYSQYDELLKSSGTTRLVYAAVLGKTDGDKAAIKQYLQEAATCNPELAEDPKYKELAKAYSLDTEKTRVGIELEKTAQNTNSDKLNQSTSTDKQEDKTDSKKADKKEEEGDDPLKLLKQAKEAKTLGEAKPLFERAMASADALNEKLEKEVAPKAKELAQQIKDWEKENKPKSAKLAKELEAEEKKLTKEQKEKIKASSAVMTDENASEAQRKKATEEIKSTAPTWAAKLEEFQTFIAPYLEGSQKLQAIMSGAEEIQQARVSSRCEFAKALEGFGDKETAKQYYREAISKCGASPQMLAEYFGSRTDKDGKPAKNPFETVAAVSQHFEKLKGEKDITVIRAELDAARKEAKGITPADQAMLKDLRKLYQDAANEQKAEFDQTKDKLSEEEKLAAQEKLKHTQAMAESCQSASHLPGLVDMQIAQIAVETRDHQTAFDIANEIKDKYPEIAAKPEFAELEKKCEKPGVGTWIEDHIGKEITCDVAAIGAALSAAWYAAPTGFVAGGAAGIETGPGALFTGTLGALVAGTTAGSLAYSAAHASLGDNVDASTFGKGALLSGSWVLGSELKGLYMAANAAKGIKFASMAGEGVTVAEGAANESLALMQGTATEATVASAAKLSTGQKVWSAITWPVRTASTTVGNLVKPITTPISKAWSPVGKFITGENRIERYKGYFENSQRFENWAGKLSSGKHALVSDVLAVGVGSTAYYAGNEAPNYYQHRDLQGSLANVTSEVGSNMLNYARFSPSVWALGWKPAMALNVGLNMYDKSKEARPENAPNTDKEQLADDSEDGVDAERRAAKPVAVDTNSEKKDENQEAAE